MSKNKQNRRLSDLMASFSKLESEHEAKAQALEEKWLLDAGIKKEDLYPPEERARRFDAMLTICGLTPHMDAKELQEKIRKNPLPKEMPSTEALETRARALRAKHKRPTKAKHKPTPKAKAPQTKQQQRLALKIEAALLGLRSGSHSDKDVATALQEIRSAINASGEPNDKKA